MKICYLTSRPDHPLLAATAALLTPAHEVTWIDPARRTTGSGDTDPAADALADVYLLKARTPQALALARSFEERGAPVLNSAAATERCQDRVVMADLALRAGLPFARTLATGPLGRPPAASPDVLPYPLVVKSRHSRRQDLVARVDDPARLRALAAEWPDEPVVVQEFTANSGWDHKLWVIDGQVFAALRRSELADTATDPAPGDRTDPAPAPEPVPAPGTPGVPPGVPPPPVPSPPVPSPALLPSDLPAGWLDLVRAAGEVFALDVYGVDVIDTGGGTPLIVDINAFPGVRGQAGAPEALAALALARARTQRPSRPCPTSP